MFLTNGFDRSSIDAIASAAGMAKRTIYARYPDKDSLFEAAVQRAVDRWIVPVETLRAVESDDLEETLVAIARIRLERFTSPDGLALQRILNAEGHRFPDLYRLAFDQGTVPALRFIGEVLTRHAALGMIEVDDPETLAGIFLSMTVGGPATGFTWGVVLDPDVVERRIRACVRLFLDGARPR